MGGASAPMPSAQTRRCLQAIGANSVGAEAPPTKDLGDAMRDEINASQTTPAGSAA
ncbi:DUF6053 domain-containing protein [Lysobacter capsici]|uniref:DUF6053 domain-containing protein n=1 Tax=Lysobacter capsici TaxID=435897 RepID=UPI003D2F89A9